MCVLRKAFSLGVVKLIALAVLESWEVCTFSSKGSLLFLKDEVICTNPSDSPR